MIIETTLGPLDESLLIKREGLIDNENERTQTVEYCLKGCKGVAHITGKADSEMHFCNQHVHRSVHIELKKVAFSETEVGVIG
jgi:hypothetical protein